MRDGPLHFEQGSKGVGEEVTFIFSGNESVFHMDGGTKIDFMAPKRGDLKGLVFAQHTEKQVGSAAKLPTGISIIKVAGNLNLIGTAYLPEQKITFSRGSISEAQAPATSFIAYQILISDAAKISVAVDHQTAGLPPILPRSDESARLVE